MDCLGPRRLAESIFKRVGHVTVPYRHFILVWGGFMGEKEDINAPCEYCPTDQVWMYNCHTEVWTLAMTEGKAPLKNSGSTGLVLDEYLYIYGGIEELAGDEWRYSNNLYRLSLLTRVWEKLSPAGIKPLGCDKGAGWSYANRLYYFGGYGQGPRQDSSRYKFTVDDGSREGSRGWNNQLCCYDPQGNKWVWPQCRGCIPQPRAAHAAHISTTTAFVFGGRLGHLRNNDLYALDMIEMKWSHNLTMEHNGVVPEGRSWHSFNFIETNRAILYGGLDQQGLPCQTWWELRLYLKDSSGPSWRNVNSNGSKISGGCGVLKLEWVEHRMLEPLVWHKAAASTSTGELVIVGGVSQSPYTMSKDDHVEQLLVLRFQPVTLFRLCLNCIVKNVKVNDIEVSKILPTMLSNVLTARLYCQ